MDFTAFDLRVGTVVEAERQGDALALVIDLGGVRRPAHPRITERYGPDDLLGTQVVVVTDASDDEVIVLAGIHPVEGAAVVRPDRPVPAGTLVV